MNITRGLFITFEGIEGSGKSTQIGLFCEFLAREGIGYVRTLEPGGTVISERIREILLSVEHKAMTAETELLLYAAARAQHVDELIRPALAEGRVVVCDRFSDSTLAYQGFGRGIDRPLIEKINAICTKGLVPDLTFLLDLDAEQGLERNRSARKVDRLELESVEFHRRVRKGFLEIAGSQPGRFRVVDAAAGIEDASDQIKDYFLDFVKEKGYVL